MKSKLAVSLLVPGFLCLAAVQARAGECVMTVLRTACSEGTKEEVRNEIKKTGSMKACEKEASKACENNGDRQRVIRSKAVSARYNGSLVEDGKNFCNANRPDFNKCDGQKDSGKT